MKNKNSRRFRALGLPLVLAIALAGLVAGCADSDSGGSEGVTVSLQELQRQLGYSDEDATNSLTSPTADENDPTTSVARSIVVGAVVVRSRTLAQEPYGDRVPIVDIETQLEQDIRDSAQFITLKKLPTTEDTITVELPPPATVKWQLMGAAFSTQPANKEALANLATQVSTVYIGFDSRYLASTTEGDVVTVDSVGARSADPVTDLTLSLKRACLINVVDPPKGCAQFDPSTSFLVASSSVEIIDVEIDGVSAAPLSGFSYPIIVRTEDDVNTVRAVLTGLFDPAVHTSAEVFTTHQESAAQNPDCQTSTTVADLAANCSVETYFTPNQ